MNPPDEFLKHAADCEQMAKFTRDPESMATWNRMAERWRRCAEIFISQNSAAPPPNAGKATSASRSWLGSSLIPNP
jgi:hypothetical protein